MKNLVIDQSKNIRKPVLRLPSKQNYLQGLLMHFNLVKALYFAHLEIGEHEICYSSRAKEI